jgi:hypothetical protein
VTTSTCSIEECPLKKAFDDLKETQYRIDHDFLKGPVCTLMGLSDLFVLLIEKGRYEEAKGIAVELKKTGGHLLEGISHILNNNVCDNEKNDFAPCIFRNAGGHKNC